MRTGQAPPFRLGEPLIHVDAIGSTMDLAASLANGGATEGTTVVADHQTAGRGRHGRYWQAPAGSALLMSVLLRPELPGNRLGILSVLSGLAIARSLARYRVPSVRIKWPNDVLIDGRKAAGILTSSRLEPDGRPRHVIVGLGVNVNAHPADGSSPSTALVLHVDHPVAVQELLDVVLDEFSMVYARNRARIDPADLVDVQRHLAYVGERVEVIDGGRAIDGVVEEVDVDGALILSSGSGDRIRVVSGELTRGPRPLRPA